jgi:hypothetical protein
MAEPTLSEIFGANATQDASSLTIDKDDLVAVGLTVSATNTAESLLAAIVALAQKFLTEDNLTANADQSTYIEDGLPNLITRNEALRRQQTKTIIFEKPDTQTNFDPDDY